MHTFMFIIVPILMVGMFIFSFIMIFSSKARGKMMSKQMKAMRYAIEESKPDIEKMGTDAGNAAVNIKKNILDENEDVLKEMAEKEANIEKGAIKTKSKAVREGLLGEDTIYCKHCGNVIDADSKFCKSCGKEQ